MSKKKGAHEFIISNQGKYIRHFDKMYKNIKDLCRSSKKGIDDISFTLMMQNLLLLFKEGNILDIGCGLVHLSDNIKKSLLATNYIGYDIDRLRVLLINSGRFKEVLLCDYYDKDERIPVDIFQLV